MAQWSMCNESPYLRNALNKSMFCTWSLTSQSHRSVLSHTASPTIYSTDEINSNPLWLEHEAYANKKRPHYPVISSILCHDCSVWLHKKLIDHRGRMLHGSQSLPNIIYPFKANLVARGIRFCCRSHRMDMSRGIRLLKFKETDVRRRRASKKKSILELLNVGGAWKKLPWRRLWMIGRMANVS